MHFQMIKMPLTGCVIFVCFLYLTFWNPILEKQAAAQFIVPIEEIEFKAPAIPSPLWTTNSLVMRELSLLSARTYTERELEPKSAEHTYNFREKIEEFVLGLDSEEKDSVLEFSEKIIRKAQAKKDKKFGLIPTFSNMEAIVSFKYIKGDFGIARSDEGENVARLEHEIEYDGNIASTYFKIALNSEKSFSFGPILLYDHFSLESFDMDRLGVMIFGRHKRRFSKSDFNIVYSGNYLRHMIDSNINQVEFENYSTYSIDLSVSLNFDKKEVYQGLSVKQPKIIEPKFDFVWGIAFSYHFQYDDVKREGVEDNMVVKEVDFQHLLMLGGNAGMRLGENLSLSLYAIWNYDLTEYKGSLHDSDDNYFDVMLKGVWNLSRKWQFKGGYKKVLFYKDLDVDHMYVSASYRF